VIVDHTRLAVVAEAESWIRTPYRHAGRVKGAGVDCLTLLAEVYERAGVVPHIDVPYYPADWNLHRDIERYLEGVARHAREFDDHDPLPGDFVLVKFGRCFAHSAIVVDWPGRVIHAWVDLRQVGWGDVRQPPFLMSNGRDRRSTRYFDPFV
jgi:cell wall-associated NlpC family hydrolase